MELLKSIRKLRIVALFLFIFPAFAIIGSLVIHNYLVSFKYSKDTNYNFETNLSGSSIEILCSEDNNFCRDRIEKFKTLKPCYENEIDTKYLDAKANFEIKSFKSIEDIEYYDGNVIFRAEISSRKNENCILNSNSNYLYSIFPLFYETVVSVKDNAKLGTSVSVNPFFYGETSISNIAKRYPVNFFFKSFLYISGVLMFIYWRYYNTVINEINSTQKNNLFFLFGILSAIFLILHVFFLGWTFESEFLTKLRRTFVVFFVFFEILAQSFLIKKIVNIKYKIKDYVNNIYIYLKLFLVILICSITIIILFILIFYNLDSKIDYILEWNYFVVLLIFYLLSFLMWKKFNQI